jgi:flavin reductase (DIM6/NTAB) family NADH-FMN oxidoreductase RutF
MRRALRALTHGVYVLSTHHNGADDFLIVSLVMQCSVEPPRIALAISNSARILPAFRTAGRGVLSVLDANQIAAVRRYGTPGGVRHAPTDALRTTHAIPIPPEASFWLELATHTEQSDADHVLFVANVIGADVTNAGDASFTPLTLAHTGYPYAG